ncbi:MAG: hypothetical protein JXX28_07750 [Deltaproteobacteria bacterium]|nr:hypothetical protein [Deltaproteobacteria bacterium]
MRTPLSTPLALAGALASLWSSAPAGAYPFMVRAGTTNCADCHVDPSGGGVLTAYGRDQGLAMGRGGDRAELGAFAFGAVSLPEAVMLQADSRTLLIPDPSNPRVLAMQDDLRGAIRTGHFVVSGSLGMVSEGAQKAQLTSQPAGVNAVAREYWAGYTPSSAVTVRAGRMNLPFGLRSEEHFLYAREVTATDTNDSQQAGVAVAYASWNLRGEVMGIAGNPQVSPDRYRERGLSGNVAWAPSSKAEVGLSGLWGHAQLDPSARVERTRGAAGVFGRAVLPASVVLLAEADLTADGQGADPAQIGGVGFVELDAEPLQGVHVRGTGEYCTPGGGSEASYAGWLGGQWFFAPHADLRLDVAYGSLYCTPSPEPRVMGLAQAHLYL